jgi:deoxyribonuclease-4
MRSRSRARARVQQRRRLPAGDGAARIVGAAPYIGSMTLPIGAHVEQSDPVAAAAAPDVPLVQFFLGNPQSYKGPVLEYAGGAAALRADAQAAGVDLYVHAPYLINVATTNNRQRIPSRKLLQQHVDAAAEIGAKGLIVHGGHVTDEDDPAKGYDNWRKAVEATDLKVPLLIENTAGGTNAMTRYLERIAGVWDAIESAEGADQVGFCLDTCHAHAGGNAMETVVEDVLRITGRIDLVHCNDSRDSFDSGADRHANLGAGQIDPDVLAAVVRDAGAPVVLETPGPADAHVADIAWLRERL